MEPSAEEQDADNESNFPIKLRLENNRREMRVTKPTFIPYRRRKKIEVFALPEVPSATRAYSSDSETQKVTMTVL